MKNLQIQELLNDYLIFLFENIENLDYFKALEIHKNIIEYKEKIKQNELSKLEIKQKFLEIEKIMNILKETRKNEEEPQIKARKNLDISELLNLKINKKFY